MMFICMAPIEKSMPSQSSRKVGMANELKVFSRPLNIPDSADVPGGSSAASSLPLDVGRPFRLLMTQLNTLHGAFIPRAESYRSVQWFRRATTSDDRRSCVMNLAHRRRLTTKLPPPSPWTHGERY